MTSVVCLSCGFDLAYLRALIEQQYPVGRESSKLYAYINESELPSRDVHHLSGFLSALQEHDTTQIMSCCCVTTLLTSFLPISHEIAPNLDDLP